MIFTFLKFSISYFLDCFLPSYFKLRILCLLYLIHPCMFLSLQGWSHCLTFSCTKNPDYAKLAKSHFALSVCNSLFYILSLWKIFPWHILDNFSSVFTQVYSFSLQFYLIFSSVQFSSVVQSCPTLCDPMDCSTKCFPVHHHLLEFTQTHVLWVGGAIQPSHPLSSPSPPAFSISQHHGLFQWVSSSHQVAKALELQLQHQSFQWIFRTDVL